MPVSQNKVLALLERVRRKPKEVRQAYALGVAGVITVLVALSWIGTIVIMGGYPGVTDEQRTQFAAAREGSAERFDMFKNEFAKQTQGSPEHAQVNELITQLQQRRQQAAGASYAGGLESSAASTTDDRQYTDTGVTDTDMTSSTTPISASSSDSYGTTY